jgi:hypothetical protein
MRVLASAVLFLAAAAALSAQAGPPRGAQQPAAVPPLEREQKLAARMVPALHALADALQAERQHARALELRREIWLEYSEHDEKARQKCGFVKVGDLWRRDENLLVLDRDLRGDPKVLKKVDQQLQALQKDALAEHRALAAAFTAAADHVRAQRHWQRVLRFAPGDKEASTALALQPFEDYRGTATDVVMLRRARTIRGACDWLRRTEFPVRVVDGEKQPLLVAAKVEHVGVRSEHFAIWGTLAPADLTVIAQDCERALLLAHTLMGTYTGVAFTPVRTRDMVFVHDAGKYGAVLDACADQFDAVRLQFLKNDVDQAFVDSAAGPLRLHKAHLGLEASRDQAVRGVVQDAIGVMRDGLYEGLGHAACGFMFGRTLTFLLEQQRDLTAASWKQKTLAPDLSVWMQIAEESAWAKSDTRTSELVLISAARFSTEQRVKAWAMCHYLLHWRPELLVELDRSRGEKVRTPPDVEAEFLHRTKVELPKIDHAWREFWGRSPALRQAMALDPVGDDKAADGKGVDKAKAAERAARLRARSLVDAVDAARAAARRGPAGFYIAGGPDVFAAKTFDEQLAKAEALRQKKPKEKIELPEPPPAIGRTLLWSRLEQPAAAVAQWLQHPAWRDRLLHPGRDLVGASTHGPSWLLDLSVAALDPRAGPPLCWPRNGQRDVRAAAFVRDLGAHAIAALGAAGKQPDAEVGMPLTLHFARPIDAKVLAKIDCRLQGAGYDAAGLIVVYPDDPASPDHAPGCVAWVPLVPLPGGSELALHWFLPKELLGEDEVFEPIRFTVQ